MGGVAPTSPYANTLTFATVVGSQTTPFVNSAFSASALSFTGSTAYTLSGNSTLTLTSATTGISHSGSAQEKITTALALGASQTWQTTSTGALTVGGNGTVSLGANTLTLTAGASGAIAVQNTITGSGGLVINGPGVVALRGENTFSGGVNVSGATSTLNINSGTALGATAGTLTLASGATINTNGTIAGTSIGAVRNVNNNAVAINGSFTFTGTNNLNLGNGAVALGANSIITATANTLTLGGIISGNQTLAKSGNGALTLSGANSFGGGANGLTLNAGTLNINNNTALGAGTFTIAGGTIDNTSGASVTLSNNNLQNWNSNFTFTGTDDLNLGTGAVTMNAARTVTTTGGNLTVGGAIGGAFALTKVGAGTLTLAGANTFTGGFTAGNATTSGGTVNINAAAALGTGAGTFTVANATTIDNSNTVAAGGTISATNTMVWNANSNVTYAGSTNSNLNLNGGLTLGGAQTLTVTQGNLTLGGAISGAGNALTKAGNGVLALGGLNSGWNGGVNLNAGTVNINSASALGSGNFTIAGGTTIDSTTTASLTTSPAQNWNGNFTFTGTTNLNLGAGAVTLGATPTITTTANTLTVGGSIGGAFGITKNGTGTLALAGAASTYTGNTTLNAGTLALNSARALGNSGTAGTLVINGGAIDNTSGGAITLTSNNAQNWNSDFTFTGSNALNLGTGAVTMNATRNITVSASTLTVGGAIDSGGSANGLTKTGAGNLILKSAGISAYGGPTIVNGGTLTLDFGISTTPANGLISSTPALTLGGGTLATIAKNNVTSNQTIGGVTLNAGGSAISATSTGTGAMNLTLGAITRNAGGTVDFTLPGTGGITTTTTNTNGILGGWATVGGAGWAVGNGTISALGAGSYTANTWSGATNTDVNNTFTVGAANASTNTLRFNNNGSRTVTLNGTNSITSGGILVTSLANNRIETISGGTLTGSSGGALFINQNGAGTTSLVINSVIADNTSATALVKSGVAALTLGGSNTYTGPTYLNAGTLVLGNDNALGANAGAGALFIQGGTLDVNAARTLSSNNAQNWNGDFAFTGTNTLNLGTGVVTLGGNRTVTTNASTLTVGGAVGDGSNGFGLTKAGAGTLVFSGANTYTGGTTISAGTLTVNSGASLAASTSSLIVNGGALNLNNTAQTVASLTGTGGTVTLGAGHTLTANSSGSDKYSGVIAGSGNLMMSGTGTLALSGTNTYTGITTIDSGTLSVGSIGAASGTSNLGVAAAGNTANLVLNGGTLQYTGANLSTDRLFTLGTSGGTIDASGRGTITFNQTTALGLSGSGARTLTLSGIGGGSLAAIIGDSGGATSLVKNGAGTWTLSGANTFTGSTTLGAGTLNITGASLIGTGNLAVNGGDLNLGSTAAQSVAALNGSAGNINVGSASSLTTGGSGAQAFSGTFSGAGALNFNGTGNLTLTGSSTNAGAVAINNGTLIVQQNNALGTGIAGTTVNSGATLNIDGGRTVNNGALTLAGGTLLGTNGNNGWGGNVTLTANSTVTNNSAAVNYLALGTSNPAAYTHGSDPAGPAQNVTTLALGANTLTLSSPTNANTIYVNAGITGTGGVTVDTAGTVNYKMNMNTYTGTTTVQNGTLLLGGYTSNFAPNDPTNPSFYTINGPLQIGDGVGSAGSAVFATPVGSAGREMLKPTTAVTIMSDGVYKNYAAQTIGTLNFSGGGKVELGDGVNGGQLFLTNTVTVPVGTTATITGNSTSSAQLDLNTAQATVAVPEVQRSFVIGGNLTIDVPIFHGGIDLTGAGTLTLQGNSSGGYDLKTNIASGSTLVAQHNSALGLAADSTIASADGTFVALGGRLQLTKLTTDLTISAEALHLNGTGISNSGALQNVSGNNTWGGPVFLDGAATINSSAAGQTLSFTGTTSDASGRTLTIDGPGTTDYKSTSAINTTSGGLTKTGDGTLILQGSNGYTGATAINQGTVLVKNNFGLGTAAGGTTVALGAELQLSKTGGGVDISVGAEALTLNGHGFTAAHDASGNTGALNNVSGNNTFGGAITLASDSSIRSTVAGETLTLNGGINVASHGLTIGGAGNITATGGITGGTIATNAAYTPNSGNNTYTIVTSNGTAGTLTKNGTGTLTLSGANTSTLDGITMTLGNITVGDGSSNATLVRAGPIISTYQSSANVLTITANSTVEGYYSSNAISAANTFSGKLAGNGTFQKDGAGILVFDTSFSAPNLTLLVTGGEIDLRRNASALGTQTNIVFGTIHIAGNTILDFDSSYATTLTSTNLIIDSGVTVTVNNWADEIDFWYATGSFYGLNGIVHTNVVTNTSNSPGTPQAQISFASANWNNLNTAWIATPYPGYTNREIRPIPEPATYGVLFFSGCLALLGWRRYSRRSSPRQE